MGGYGFCGVGFLEFRTTQRRIQDPTGTFTLECPHVVQDHTDILSLTRLAGGQTTPPLKLNSNVLTINLALAAIPALFMCQYLITSTPHYCHVPTFDVNPTAPQ